MNKSILAALLVIGCSSPMTTPTPPAATRPALSALATIDPALTAPTASCAGGWIVHESAHAGDQGTLQFAHTSDATWHAIYRETYTFGGKWYGWRYLSSADPVHALSIAWSDNMALAIGSDDVPTVFYDSLDGDTRSVLRARLSGGVWTTDKTPVWSGGKDAIESIHAYYAGAIAHVLINAPTPALVIDNGAGGWTSSQPLVDAGSAILTYIVDGAGNDWFNDMVFSTNVAHMATNASGSWVQSDIATNFFGLDPNGKVLAFLGGINTLTVVGLSESPQPMTTFSEAVLGGLVYAAVDPLGHTEFLINDNGTPNPLGPTDYSNATGTIVGSTLSAVPSYVQSGGLAFDAQDQPHYALGHFSGPDIENTARIAFADSCH